MKIVAVGRAYRSKKGAQPALPHSLYGLAINPETKEIFVTDAKNYVNPGRLYSFTPDGKYKWDVATGDIPAHIVFTRKKLAVLN
jgi:DNA-binding beta-propeller fold protein YncE